MKLKQNPFIDTLCIEQEAVKGMLRSSLSCLNLWVHYTCILAMRMAFRGLGRLPENFKFIADGYSAYPLAAMEFAKKLGEGSLLTHRVRGCHGIDHLG